MGGSIKKQISKLLRSKKTHKYQVTLVLCLALIVALGTVAVLKLPGVAMTHQEKVLDCQFAGNAAHTHNDDCYDANGNLVCPLAERPLHTHDDSCYTAETELVCGMEESEGHQHTDDCYELVRGELICEDESEDHEHTDECYEWTAELVCGYEEGEGAHTHTDDCYVTTETLTCGLEELTEEHVHSDDCFTIVELSADEVAELNSEPAEDGEAAAAETEAAETEAATIEDEAAEAAEGAELQAEAVDLTAGDFDADELFESTDDVDDVQGEQGGDPNADVETWADWDAMFADMELTGKWDEDLIRVAETQIGYTESVANYIINEEGKQKGYTRYGEWYGSPYGDWCAMFVSFCLNYAEIPTDAMPIEASCPRWVDALSDWGMYAEAGAYDPQPGDLIFFTRDGNTAVHVGIVYAVNDGVIKTIEGNSADSVRNVKYSDSDWHILGYGILPENPDMHAAEETETVSMPAMSFEAWADDVKVTVNAPEGAFPEGTVMYVEMVQDDSIITAAASAIEIDEPVVQAVNITFMYNDEEIEPAVPIAVSMSSEMISEFEAPVVVHVMDDGTTQVVDDAAQSEDGDIYFDAGEFSVYAVLTDFINSFGYPKQQFEAVAGDVTVTVTAERGAFPKNSQMIVTPVDEIEVLDAVSNAVGTEVGSIAAVDITFLDADGNDIEPQKPISVTMTSAVVAQAEEPVVVHVDDHGIGEVIDAVIDGEEDVSFKSDAFSIYAIVDSAPVYRTRFVFQNADGTPYTFLNTAGEEVNNQIVKTGESLSDVGRPDYVTDPESDDFDGWHSFNGWHIWTGTGWGDEVKFDTPITVTSALGPGESWEDENAYLKTVTVRPVLGDVVYIDFYINSVGTNVATRVQIPLGEDGTATYDIRRQSLEAPLAGYAFVGWSLEPGPDPDPEGGDVQDDRTVISGTNAVVTLRKNEAENDVYKLYPVFKPGHWIRFVANEQTGTGASYTAPVFVVRGDRATNAQPEDPTWKGHKFDYWSETKPVYDENGNLTNNPPQFNWNQELEDDVRLYAVWENDYTTYTVIYWKQLITDTVGGEKHYEYGGQDVVSAKSGSTASVSTYSDKYTGFEVNTAKSDKNLVVNYDGSSVMNIYYDRQVITMKFRYQDSGNYSWDFNSTTSTYSQAGAYDTDAPQYAYENGEYVMLDRIEHANYVANDADAVPRYGVDSSGNYVLLDRIDNYGYHEDNSDGTERYALVNGEYILLEREADYHQATTETPQSNVKYYGIDANGEYHELSYTSSVSSVTWTYSYNGNQTLTSSQYDRIYTRSTSGCDTEYTKVNNFNPNDATSATTYYVKVNNINSQTNSDSDYRRLTPTVNYDYTWYMNGSEYPGTRYKIVNQAQSITYKLNGEVYEGQRYAKDDTPTHSWELNGEPYDGQRYVKGDTTSYSWELNGEPYNGTRYKPTYLVYQGLYGQKLTDLGVVWPSGVWRYFNDTTSNNTSGFTGMTYLGQFVLPDGVRDNTGKEIRLIQNSTANLTYNFYLQGVDGQYRLDATGYGHVDRGSTSKFTFSEKYNGYTVKHYALNDGAMQDAAVDGEVNYMRSGDKLDVYYDLKTFQLTLADSTDGTPLTTIISNKYDQGIASVKYTEDLKSYEPTNVTIISQTPGKVWDGKWYADRECTETLEFDWDQTMPDHDMVAYAGWTDEYYVVQIDPNGGALTEGESTYFWTTYGKTIRRYNDVVRYYVPTAEGEGDYNYVINTYDGYIEQGHTAQELWDGYQDYETFPRSAYYVAATGGNYKLDPTVYSLVGWYKVENDGKLSIYDFEAGVTGNLKICALWRIGGEYHVLYSTNGIVVDEEMVPQMDGDAYVTVEASSTPHDNYSYADKSETAMLGKAGAPNTTDKYEFMGWYYNGAVYQPGEVFQVMAELAETDAQTGQKYITIYPIFMKSDLLPVETIEVTWHANDGTDTKVVDQPLQINAELSIKPADTFTRKGYKFLGWAKTPTATSPWLAYNEEDGKFYIGEEEARIAADDLTNETNDLYALWERTTVTVTVQKIANGTDADKTEQFVIVDDSNNLSQENFLLVNGEQNKKTFEILYGTEFGLFESNANNYDVAISVVKDGGAQETWTNNRDARHVADDNMTITITNTRVKQTIQIYKIDSVYGNALPGAEFTLSGGDLPSPITMTSGADGYLTIDGQKDIVLTVGQEYTLTETKAPQGYYGLAESIKIKPTVSNVDVTADSNTVSRAFAKTTDNNEQEITTSTVIITVKNSTGQVLPHTGGIGTTIFYVVGGILVVGAIALLITKRRVRHDEGDDEV